MHSLNLFVNSLAVGRMNPFNLVKVPMETFGYDGFVIALGDQMPSYHQDRACLDNQILEL